MRILEIDALVADRRHGRRRFGRDLERAQAVGHEQNDVVRTRFFRSDGLQRKNRARERDQGSAKASIVCLPAAAVFRARLDF